MKILIIRRDNIGDVALRRLGLGHRRQIDRLRLDGGDLLELYCGNGNFTLPLATRVRKVLATEISKSSVNAALANLADNGVDNVTLVRLSAEELTQASTDAARKLAKQRFFEASV